MDLLARVKQLADLVEEEAHRLGIPVTFCALDIHGNIVLKQRMTGAMLVSIEMSERKAYTAAALRARTADLTALALPGEPLYTLASAAGGRFVVLGGGVPLYVGDGLIAGVGVSGGTTEQDVDIIETALARFESAQGQTARV